MIRDAAIVLAAFALGTGIAVVLGAANFGTALGVGQIVFALTLIWVMPGRRAARAGRAADPT